MEPSNRVTAVVPTCRGFKIPEQTIPVDWIIVHDRKLQDVDGDAVHITAPEKGFYGRGCDSIRSAGFLRAYLDGAQYILTVDDDCQIPPDWAEKHVEALQSIVHPWSFTVEDVLTRGMPYEGNPKAVAISHGLWDNILDLDAETQKACPALAGYKHEGKWKQIHAPFAQSSMNLGFRRAATPCMYQPNQGEGTPFDRFADIWGGMFAQYCLMQHGYAFMNGGALVTHDRASNVETNLIKERPGKEVHETLWECVFSMPMHGATPAHTYCMLAGKIENFFGNDDIQMQYFENLAANMRRWVHELGCPI